MLTWFNCGVNWICKLFKGDTLWNLWKQWAKRGAK